MQNKFLFYLHVIDANTEMRNYGRHCVLWYVYDFLALIRLHDGKKNSNNPLALPCYAKFLRCLAFTEEVTPVSAWKFLSKSFTVTDSTSN